MKKFLLVFFSLLLACGIVFGLPYLFNEETEIDSSKINETSLIKQEVLSYSKQENKYHKLYAGGYLVGVVTDLDYLNSLIDLKYQDYEADFPNTSLGFDYDVTIVEEASYCVFEDIDDEIMNYLVDNNYLGVKTTSVEFSTSEGVYEIIYVKDIEDFYSARDAFLLNFISEEALNKLRQAEQISEPSELGSVETGLSITETISFQEAIVSPTEIFASESEIYNFLCYGRNEEREYYTVKEGDTLQGVGYYFGDMSTKQIVMINPNLLYSEDQVVVPGMEINVTYYTSPITVNVTKENLTQESITPDTPEYVEDEELEAGTTEILVEEEAGIKNVLYKENWVNGVLQTGEAISENIIKQPVRGKIAVGTKVVVYVGTGNYIWPVDNPRVTCNYGCYLNHTGTDFINKYNRYGPIYAADSGVVVSVGYKDDMGYFCIIDHQNGVRTFYMHMYSRCYKEVGDNVSRGDIIGQIGNSGNSQGAHLHFTFELNGERVDACNYLPCSLLE